MFTQELYYDSVKLFISKNNICKNFGLLFEVFPETYKIKYYEKDAYAIGSCWVICVFRMF